MHSKISWKAPDREFLPGNGLLLIESRVHQTREKGVFGEVRVVSVVGMGQDKEGDHAQGVQQPRQPS